jgi:hypothetical protein
MFKITFFVLIFVAAGLAQAEDKSPMPPSRTNILGSKKMNFSEIEGDFRNRPPADNGVIDLI